MGVPRLGLAGGAAMSLFWLWLACPQGEPTLPSVPPASANLAITPLAPSLQGDDPSAAIAARLAAELEASRLLAPPRKR